MKTTVLLASASACFSSLAIAQTERDLDSHLHGAAGLNVAIVESSVILEFNTPWNNLVGFEHAPRTDEQHTLVDNAMKQLNEPDTLFSFMDGKCTVTEVLVENSMSAEGDHHDEHDDEHHDEHADEHHDEHEDEHHDEHADEHDDEHEDEHHDEHADKHDDEHEDEHHDEHGDEHHDEHGDKESSHSSVLATYSYECGEINQLDKINLSLFKVWPGVVDLDVQLVGASTQTLLELNAGNASLDVAQVR